jgi:ORF6N domain-containing protein
MADSAIGRTAVEVVAAPTIEKRIFVIRGRQVMLDEDLAELYGVETRALVQQVRRNEKRFPADFMFQLSDDEFSHLEITICDVKRLTRRSPQATARLHRAGRGDALGGAAQRPSYRRKHRDHAGVR